MTSRVATRVRSRAVGDSRRLGFFSDDYSRVYALILKRAGQNPVIDSFDGYPAAEGSGQRSLIRFASEDGLSSGVCGLVLPPLISAGDGCVARRAFSRHRAGLGRYILSQ